jgi:ribosomal protein S18 acetylase RimI-like enzyme
LWLREVFLVPAEQGQGIGSKLVLQEIAGARRLGKPLRLRVLRQNRARALYERLGFSVCGETETQYWMEVT